MPRVLFVQIREDAMKEHEFQCVREKISLTSDDLVSFDIFSRLLTLSDLDGFEALIIGGSGGYCLSERKIEPQCHSIKEAVREARRRRLPILGICFGHHLITEALGGAVTQDRERQEVGTFEIKQKSAARLDPIFSLLPERFFAQEGHKDHVVALPPGAVLLASTDGSPYQIFTFPGEPIYSIQLHPELNRQDVAERLEFYRGLYLKSLIRSRTEAGVQVEGVSANGQDEFDQIMRCTFETPEAERILKLFMSEIILAGKFYPQK